jgi:4-amino-4-deoxy-L-arabinose transferase-like glycosyltransferase
MTRNPYPATEFQPHAYGTAGLAVLIALYLLPGLIGHDPWRGDDARHFGPVFEILTGNGALFPHIAGEPATNFPPLYYWTGALLATLLGWLVPLHDAARLSTALFTALTIFWIARASSRLYGRHTRTAAALLTLGTLGLVLHAHEMQPMIALIAMQAMTLAGLSLVPTRPVAGSVQAGMGAALAFLTAGLPGVLLTVPLFLAVLAASPECRNPRASGGLILGLSLAIGVSAIWPLILHYRNPELLALWWRSEWATFGSDALSTQDLPRLFELLGWFVWPLWPIALWSLWRARTQLALIAWTLPITAALLAIAWIVANGSLSPPAMLPLIPPIALLAAAGVPSLRRGAANAFDWFAVMTFAVFGILVWIAWTAQVFHWPPGLARHLARISPEFELQGTLIQALIGVGISITWLLLMWRLPRTLSRGPASWAMGMTMLWCLAVALLMPWFDHDRSYRPVAESLAIALSGERDGCVATLDLSAAQRASFHYFANLRPERVSGNETACRLLLVFDDRGNLAVTPEEEWQPIWTYRRGGGKQLEVFRLFRRD